MLIEHRNIITYNLTLSAKDNSEKGKKKKVQHTIELNSIWSQIQRNLHRAKLF